MANTGKNSPLGVNVTGDYLNNTGLNINPVAQSYMGISKRNARYTFGSCVSATCLRLLTYAINDAYNRGVVSKTPAGSSVYDNLISIGSSSIPALGNSKPPTYVPVDPAGVWARTSTTSSTPSMAEQYGIQTGYSNALPGPATSGYGNYDGAYGDPLQGYGVTDQKESATWYPYNMTNPNHSVTQWGWIRCHALQAWNEFNWNGMVVDPNDPGLPSYLQGYKVPNYNDFLTSVSAGQGYITQTNQFSQAVHNSTTFLDGTYSNMNDLISADITGVSLSTITFGTDLENLGMALSLANIDSFGLPSNLLRTLGNQGAITQDLSLVLLATGLTSVEISEIAEGVIANPTEDQERKIYGAFLMMTGENLKAIIAPIQCKTKGLTSLADLLDVQKMFPNSYTSLTVPMYNATPGPTNSKTYYLIYTGTGVNPALKTPEMREYVGTLVPAGSPPVSETSTSPANYREIPKGFDSYLAGIIPENQAIAAGAFSFTMRQINSVQTFDVQQFAKVVKGIENVSDLPLTAGTSKPTNQQMINQSTAKNSLGTGPYGSYTMSDLFGCMSGLPYPWQLIKERTNQLETRKLYDIYNQLYLAVTWDPAAITVVPETREVEISPGIFQTEYRVARLIVSNPGGGYGRGNAPNPIITCSNGGSGEGLIGRNDTNVGTMGAGSFGRVNSTTVTSSGSWVLSPPTATIQCPPIDGLPVANTIATGGTNTSAGTTGWPQPMNQVVEAYIGQANAEIASILQNNNVTANYLNTYWNIMGTQLVIEQRTRYKAIVPSAVPKNMFDTSYPSAIMGFVDSIPQFAQDTRPHMTAQLLEAISNTSTVGGQSTIGMMRQERNQARLQLLGIEQDNAIPDTLTDNETKQLTANGTIPGAVVGAGISSTGLGGLGEDGTSLLGTSSPTVYTLPAWHSVPAPSAVAIDPELQDPDELTPVPEAIVPAPAGSYVPTWSPNFPIESFPPGFNTNNQLPPGFGTNDQIPPGFYTNDELAPGDITPILEGVPYPSVGPLVPVGPNLTENPYGDGPVIIQPPVEYDPTNLPPYLDPRFTRNTMLPAVPSVKEAIDRVIECNCDCWIS